MSLVSIGLPVHNAGETLGVAIQSILLQTFEDWELIIIDDGSNDRSSEIAMSFGDPRIRVYTEREKKGITRCLNQAIQLADGKFFARMDGDDISFPQRFEKQVAFLQKNVAIDLMGTGMIVFAGEGNIKGLMPVKQTHEEICKNPWWGFSLAHPTWMGRMEWFKKNPYPELPCRRSLRGLLDRAQDQGLLFRTWKKSRFANIPDALLGYRENPRNQAKALFTRYAIVQSFGRACLEKSEFVLLGKIIGIQVAKAMIDILYLLLGCNRQRKGLLPVPEETLIAWNSLLRTVSEGALSQKEKPPF